MLNVSNDFKAAMRVRRNFASYAVVSFPDGGEYTLDGTKFTVGENSITDGAGTSDFPLGAAVAKTISLEIANRGDIPTDFLGARIRLYVDFPLDGGKVERVERGIFTVVTPETYGDTITIIACDDMYKADREYTTGLRFPQTAGAVLQDICATCGINLGSSTFPHDDYRIEVMPTGTCREIIGQIAMIACGNARIDTDGLLRIMPYDLDFAAAENKYAFDFAYLLVEATGIATSGVPVIGDANGGNAITIGQHGSNTLAEFITLKNEYNDVTITGFKTTVHADGEDDRVIAVGNETYCVTVENQLLMGHEETVLGWLYDALANIPFRPFTGDVIANPLIEFMDVVKILDVRGNLHNSFITDVTFNFAGATSISNSSPSMTLAASRYASNASRVERRAVDLVNKERNAREEAVKNLADRLATSSGLYMTADVQPDGSTIYYMHDKPTLDDSKIIWKLTAEAFAISTDGGGTYPYGFTVTGELITRLLYAEGINADYINTGAFTVRDDAGNIIFQADIGSKSVTISGDSVTIGGKSATAAISDNLDEAKKYTDEATAKVTALSMVLSNEYEGIPTDANGNYSGALSVATAVTVYYGHSDITASCSYSTQKSDGVTGSWSDATRTYTVTGLSTDSGWVDITASYMSIFTVTKRFSIAKAKAGTNGAKGDTGAPGRTYFIECSADVLKRGQDGKIKPASVTANAYYRDGQSAGRVSYAGRWVVATSMDGTTFTTAASSTTNESSRTYSVGALASNIIAVRFTLYAADGTTTVLDMQTLPIVVDVDALTHEQIFNLLTDNGKIKGIYQENGQLYVNGTYIQADSIQAAQMSIDNLKAVAAKLGNWNVSDNALYNGPNSLHDVNYETGDKSGTYLGIDGIMSQRWDSQVRKYSSIESGTLFSNDSYFHGTMEWASNLTILDNRRSRTILQYADGQTYVPVVEVNNVYGKTSAITSSDANGKEAVEDIPDAYRELLYRLHPVTFRYKDGESGRRHAGLIAQEVEAAMTECGITDADYGLFVREASGRCGLRYEELIAPLIAEVQRLGRRADELEAKIKVMEGTE